MNTELLAQIADVIVKRPLTLDMDIFLEETDCGTVGCIAGWACALNLSRTEALTEEQARNPLPLAHAWYEQGGGSRAAQDTLDINEAQARRLFITDRWPAALAARYHEARLEGDAPAAAQVTAERIAHFVRTGGRQ